MKRILTAISLMTLGSLAHGDNPGDCPENLAAETLCSQSASALRVQVRALQLLRKYPHDDSYHVINYLEGQSKGYEKSLRFYANKPEYQTRNVSSALTDYQSYVSAFEAAPNKR
ncbi:MAG: hypothetical protein OSB41_13360 [Kiritimatiellae bacterium]|nr:hypothetical protein [Kiritimatiellia bacterium]